VVAIVNGWLTSGFVGWNGGVRGSRYLKVGRGDPGCPSDRRYWFSRRSMMVNMVCMFELTISTE
jgi:hypothetical protein